MSPSRSDPMMADQYTDVFQLHNTEKTMQAARLHERLASDGVRLGCYSHNCPAPCHSVHPSQCYSSTCRARRAALSKIAEQAAMVRSLREELKSTDGWELHRESSGIRTLSRRTVGDSHVMIRVEGHVDAPLLNILSVFYEVDLWRLWVPSIPIMGLRSAEMVEDFSTTRFTVQMTVNTPWPIATRDMMIHVQGVDCMDPAETADEPDGKRQIVVLLTSTDTLWGGDPAPPPDESVVRMGLSVGALILTPESINGGDTGTHLAIISKIDPKLDYIPTSLINLASKYMCWLFFDRLKKQAKIIKGTEYEARVEAGGRFYTYLKEKMTAINYTEPRSDVVPS